jgi:uncharacterized membrane protein
VNRLRSPLRWLFALLFIAAGANHFRRPAFYERTIPPALPFPSLLVVVSGIAEIALGGLLLVPRTRRLAAWGIIALLIAVFPANIQMATQPEQFPQFSRAALLVRLPLQLVLIGWAWFIRGARPREEAQRRRGA